MAAWVKARLYVSARISGTNIATAQTLQQVAKDLADANANFFAKRASFPIVKKKGKAVDSFRFPQGWKLDQFNSRIFLPKLGWLRHRNSQNVFGIAKERHRKSIRAASGTCGSTLSAKSLSALPAPYTPQSEVQQ